MLFRSELRVIEAQREDLLPALLVEPPREITLELFHEQRNPFFTTARMADRILDRDVVGFGARKLFDDDDGPKYLNTPETPLYKKSHVLYGVDLARRDIAKKQQAVIVEGYTDVMACHLAGITTAVATCGTAFGGDHIKVLRRLLLDSDQFTGEVIFTFDGDAAGRKAALRAFDDDQKFVARTFVAVQPDGLDPCDLRQQRGDDALVQLIAHKSPMFEFEIGRAHV